MGIKETDVLQLMPSGEEQLVVGGEGEKEKPVPIAGFGR